MVLADKWAMTLIHVREELIVISLPVGFPDL